MRKEIHDSIRKHFPGPHYPDLDEILDTMSSKPKNIENIIREIGRHSKYRMKGIVDENHSVCYELYIFISEPVYEVHIGSDLRDDWDDNKKIALLTKIGGVGHYMNLFISRIGPYFCKSWTEYKAVKSQLEMSVLDSAPDADWENASRHIDGILAEEGFAEVSSMERKEIVPWLDPGESLFIEENVTVYNCLFHELGDP